MSRTNRTYTATPERFFPDTEYVRNVNNDGGRVPPRCRKPCAIGYVWKGYLEGCSDPRGKAKYKKQRNKLHRLERKRELATMLDD